MVNKILGYILFGVGIISVALSYASIRTIAGITLPSSLVASDGLYLLIGGVVILILGAFLAFKGFSGKQAEEVPIYKGKEIVGYRRLK